MRRAPPEAAGDRPPSSKRRLAGGLLLAVSTLLGWPGIALAGFLAVRLDEPLLLAVGGPCLLVVAHLLFALGGWLAGGDRLLALVRRLGR